LLRPPLDPSNMSAAAAAAWLGSGAWLVPAGLANVTQSPSTSGIACGPGISAASGHGPYLSLHNLTMLVNPQSLMLVQQALCIAAASPAAAPLSTLVGKVGIRRCSCGDQAGYQECCVTSQLLDMYSVQGSWIHVAACVIAMCDM
jgi:hypothetical protein